MGMNPMNLLLQLLLLSLVSSLPQTITVNHNSKECLYDLIEEGEKVTVSIFILSGAELKGGLLLEGPLSPDNITSGRELQAMIDLHDHHKSGRTFQKIEEDINFERILPGSAEEEAFNPDDEGGEDDDANLWKQMDDDKLTEEEIQRRTTERKRHAQIARKRALEARRKRAERMRANNVVSDGEPIQRTLMAKSRGWYRACVKGNWYQITAELEMRKESDLGGADSLTGHVLTHAEKEDMEENKFLEEDSALQEEGAISDEDFTIVKGQLQRLRHLLSLIQQKQATERHRLTVHAATNEHSHSQMVLSNLFQTVLFMAVTGFQVYTIRKWFHGQVLAQ
jgi:emp24/gp25L/p24 family/GOLD